MYVQSVDLFYKICRGTQSGSYESIEFIYPGRNNKNLKNRYLPIDLDNIAIIYYTYRYKMVWTR